MVRESGGVAPDGISSSEETLDENQAELIEEWIRELVMERKRVLSSAV
jgi:hypothetical protein